MRFEAADRGDVFPLIALHALDEDFGRGFVLGGAFLLLRGLGLFLCAVLLGAFLGVEGEGGEGCCYGGWRVENEDADG